MSISGWHGSCRRPGREHALPVPGDRVGSRSVGQSVSVGQYALIGEDELVGANVVTCVNLGEREMGPYVSQALVLGAPHPASPEGQAQAIPIVVAGDAVPGDAIY